MFDNVEIAFKYRTNKDLLHTYWLFKIMSVPWIVKAGKLILSAAIKMHIPVSWIVKPTIFKHFCGGETIDEAAQVITLLQKFNIKTILDYSVEGKENEKAYAIALEETLCTITKAAQDKNIPFAVFKPSGFGMRSILEKASDGLNLTETEKIELQNFKSRIEILCRTAYESNIRIMIDAEHSYYQLIIDQVCEEMMEKFNKQRAIVFNTLQMYRIDRLDYLHNLYTRALEKGYYLGIKFVRGAYMEKERERALKYGYPSPIQPDKEATDKHYNEALRFAITHVDLIEIFNGTHNEESSELLTFLMQQAGLPNNSPKIWFSQLYGMSDNISFNLASAGYNVAKYVPYGPVKHVVPYLMRRAEENTSVKGQTGRELCMIRMERQRRKELAKKGIQ